MIGTLQNARRAHPQVSGFPFGGSSLISHLSSQQMRFLWFIEVINSSDLGLWMLSLISSTQGALLWPPFSALWPGHSLKELNGATVGLISFVFYSPWTAVIYCLIASVLQTTVKDNLSIFCFFAWKGWWNRSLLLKLGWNWKSLFLEDSNRAWSLIILYPNVWDTIKTCLINKKIEKTSTIYKEKDAQRLPTLCWSTSKYTLKQL